MIARDRRLMCVGLPTSAMPNAGVGAVVTSVRSAVGEAAAGAYVAALVGECADDAGVLGAVSHLATVAPHLAVIAVVGCCDDEQEEALLDAGAQDVMSLEALHNNRWAGVVRRAVARQRRTAELAWQSVRDPLTGLLNRRGFDVAAEQVLRSADRAEETVLALLLDVDGLKSLNDSQGHAVGDAALRDVAEALRRSLRASDVMGRIGGDEFAVVAPGAEAQHGQVIAGRIASDLRTGAGRVTVSAGWAARAARDRACVADLLRAADAMLYERKRRTPVG